MQYRVALTPLAAGFLLHNHPSISLGYTRPENCLLWHAWHTIITPKVFIFAGARNMMGSNLTAPVKVEAQYRHNSRKKELMNIYESILWATAIEIEFSRVVYEEIIISQAPTQVVLAWQERLDLSEDVFNPASFIRSFHNRKNAAHPYTLLP